MSNKVATKTKRTAIPATWKQAAGILRAKKKKNQSELEKNRITWSSRLKRLSSL